MKDRDTSGGRTPGDDSSLTSYARTFLPRHEVLFGTSRSIFALMRSVLQVDDPIGRPQRQLRSVGLSVSDGGESPVPRSVRCNGLLRVACGPAASASSPVPEPTSTSLSYVLCVALLCPESAYCNGV
jgi:hypothetical protein